MYIKTLYQYYKDCGGQITTDSRNCPKGSLFIALKGENFDGNLYASKALENGAAFVIVDNPEVVIEGDDRYILVHDSLHALQQMANYHRQMLKTPIIAITGTNGKTTTKELIANVLLKKYKTHYTQGNLNNHIGVPLTILSMTASDEMAVIEMGANHPGEIKDLTRIVLPDYGLITNVGKAHLEGFGSLEGVIRTKSELYDYLKEKKNGTAFINFDDSILMKQAEGISHLITYGTSESASVCGKIDDSSLTLSLEWYKTTLSNNIQRINTQLIGDYNLSNILAAITIGVFFKVPIEDIKEALEQYTPQNNRSQFKKTESNQLIIDAYNANPTSMLAALNNFCNLKAEHKMVILGDMRELGKDSLLEHQKIIDFLTKHKDIEKVLLVGDEFCKTNHPYTHFNDVNEVKDYLVSNPITDHTILIKGSNGIRLFTLVDSF